MYGVEILLTRSLTPFLLSLYLPSSLLVSLSWLSLLLAQPLLRLGLQLLTSVLLLHLISAARARTSSANPAHSMTSVSTALPTSERAVHGAALTQTMDATTR